MIAVGVVTAVAGAIAAVAALLLFLARDRWSARAKWEKELEVLRRENREAKDRYHAAVAAGHTDADALLADWRLRAQAVSDHCRSGQRAGYFRRAEPAD